jgi:hypothetical protein
LVEWSGTSDNHFVVINVHAYMLMHVIMVFFNDDDNDNMTAAAAASYVMRVSVCGEV